MTTMPMRARASGLPARAHSRKATAALSLGALGVVYGDIGTSPLYAIQQVFVGSHKLTATDPHVFGALSLVVWSLLLIVTVKYIVLLMRAGNNGEGGIMALVALVERAVESPRQRTVLLLIGVLGASLFYGDGMITPAISVMSAVEGLNVASPSLSSNVIPISLFVLIVLFLAQRLGTGAVGVLFGPITAVWFAAIGLCGAVEVAAHPDILKSLSPTYGAMFLADDPHGGFLSLGAVVLAVTGAEALYADMGHFGRPAITRAWVAIVFPALILNYLGQGALLLHNPSAADNPFYRLVPEWGQLPMVFLATIATIIASQAVISGAFSLTRQAVQLGLLPRVTIRHTSKSMEGQIYIPFINWALLIAVIGLVVGFGSSSHLASAYGIAVTGTFATTTILAFVVFRKLWHKPLWIVIPGAAFFLTIELTFFAANLTKIGSGGWLPLVVGLSVFTVLTTWRKGQRLVAHRMREGRIPIRRYINRLIEEPVLRVPGTAVYLTVTGDATPPALMTNVAANRVLPETVVLFTAETEGVPYVDDDKRFAIESLRLGFIRVQARYGFQERPDVFAALRRARDAGFQVDVETPAFILSHVSLVPAVNQHSLPRWRRWLFVLLQRNSTPAAQYFNLPPQMVFEVGAPVEV